MKLQRKKFLLVLPLLTIPFLTFAFWALGGGSGNSEVLQKNAGLNVELPHANLKDDDLVDKLGYYEKAESDSDKIKQFMKNDPYYKSAGADDTMVDHSMEAILPPSAYNKSAVISQRSYTDPNEMKVYKKLEELNKVMKTNEKISSSEINPVKEKLQSIPGDDVNRLEEMMRTMTTKENGEDPEMKQLNGMMEKILDIQHPERVKEKIKERSIKNKNQVFAVTVTDDEYVSILDTLPAEYIVKQQSKDQGFYSFSDDPETKVNNSVEAVIHETQTVVAGSPVKLRLSDDIYINGVLIPRDNFIFGTASLNGERLTITVNSIRFQNLLLPVALSIYDIDGLEGIYIPGAISRDVAKQSADNALQNISVSSIDPSISTQALGMGLEAGKNLLSKKSKVVRVTVKAGYKVLLIDNNNK